MQTRGGAAQAAAPQMTSTNGIGTTPFMYMPYTLSQQQQQGVAGAAPGGLDVHRQQRDTKTNGRSKNIPPSSMV